MVALPSRRVLLTSTVAVTGLWKEDPATSSASLSNLICNYTPLAFRCAVAESGRLLYRGENLGRGSKFEALSPEPDLLEEKTYDDPDALAYFQCLEQQLQKLGSQARPSTGHIGISDISEASQWGSAASIWPLGDSISYVWPEKEKLFFPTTTKCPSNDLAIDRDLIRALKEGREVLFSSHFANDKMPQLLASTSKRNSAFLAVSSELDAELLKLIQTPEFHQN